MKRAEMLSIFCIRSVCHSQHKFFFVVLVISIAESRQLILGGFLHTRKTAAQAWCFSFFSATNPYIHPSMVFGLMSLKNHHSQNYSVQQDDVVIRTESIITQAPRPNTTIVAVEMKQYEKKEITVTTASSKEEKVELDDVTLGQENNATNAKSKSLLQSLFGPLLCCFTTPLKGKQQAPFDRPSEVKKKIDNTIPLPLPVENKPLPEQQQGKRKSRRGSHKKDELGRRYLLPELSAADAKKKTLVLDLDETLVHSSFKPVKDADFIVQVEIEKVIHNVYVCKRPGVDEFLQEVGKHFEVVVFTASLSKYADPVLDYLDTTKVITGRLFREHCTYLQGNYVKDMSRLGRALSQSIIIDNSPCCYQLQPENAMACVSWYDDPSDNQLADMLPWLYKIAKEADVFESLEEFKKASNQSHFT